MSIYVFHTNETTFVVALKKNTRALENFDAFEIFNELYFLRLSLFGKFSSWRLIFFVEKHVTILG